jgi:hypothetical protein
LDVLSDQFSLRCREQSGQSVPRWITARLKEIAEIDPNSEAFRYAEIKNKASKDYKPLLLERHVNIHHLQQAMTALHSALAGVVGKLDGRRAT